MTYEEDVYAQEGYQDIFDITRKTRTGDLVLVIPKEIAEGKKMSPEVLFEAEVQYDSDANLSYSIQLNGKKYSIVFMEDGSLNTFVDGDIKYSLWLHSEMDFLKLFALISSRDRKWEGKKVIKDRIQELKDLEYMARFEAEIKERDRLLGNKEEQQ